MILEAVLLAVKFSVVVLLARMADAKYFDGGASSLPHAHQSRRSMGGGGGTEFYTPQLLSEQQQLHRVTNITTQIGTHAYLPCKVITEEPNSIKLVPSPWIVDGWITQSQTGTSDE